MGSNSSREPPQFRRQNVSPPSQNRLLTSQNYEACVHNFVKLSHYFAKLQLFCVFVDEEPRPTDKKPIEIFGNHGSDAN